MKKELFDVDRNDSCPCGSGRKAKNCCKGKEKQSTGLLWKIVLGLLLVSVIVALSVTSGRSTANQSGGNAAGTTPAPWEYDAANNRHWHAEHGHWHDGPPPGISTQQTSVQPTTQPVFGQPTPAQSGETPVPWEYDPITNRHWHPDHGHWHDGPPPDQPN